MACACGSNRTLLSVSGKTSDMCSATYGNAAASESDYVPSGLNIGGGDYLEFKMCLDCGRVQGKVQYPISEDAVLEALNG